MGIFFTCVPSYLSDCICLLRRGTCSECVIASKIGSSLPNQVPKETDFIVIGAGVAGLRAAIGLAEAGRVLLLAKQELTESATQYAQGGVAVVLSDEDEIGLHLQDTIDADRKST